MPNTHAPRLWRRRWFASAITAGMIVLSSAAFILPLRIPIEEKPAAFLQMLLGPFAHNPSLPYALINLSVFALVVLYPAFPSLGTFVLTCIVVFFWWAAGFVAVTGGV